MSTWRLGLCALAAYAAGCRPDRVAPTTASIDPPDHPPGEPVEPGLLSRGRYVAEISGCVACHTPSRDGTPDEGRLFSGAGAAPNLTPDRRTGIGDWTEAQIVTAIRTGIRPDGTRLAPLMPYPDFHRMTDRDARAVVAYLRAQPPIANASPRPRIELSPIELPPIGDNRDPDDLRGHGEYLASLLHCGTCHTPQTGPHAGVAFVGGVAFELAGGRTILSSNITNDPETGIGRWTEDQIIAAIRTMKTPSGTAIQGPMTKYAGAWSQLTEHDARALATFVKSIPPVRNDVDRAPQTSAR